MHPFKKDILSLVIILVIIISSLSACESQKGTSDYDKASRSLGILRELQEWGKIESEAFNNRDYCTAMKACQNELELWAEYKKVNDASKQVSVNEQNREQVTVNEQIREAESRLRTVRALCR